MVRSDSTRPPVDPKQIRALCPVCSWPNRVTNTMCFVCGALLDPHRQYEQIAKEDARDRGSAESD